MLEGSRAGRERSRPEERGRLLRARIRFYGVSCSLRPCRNLFLPTLGRRGGGEGGEGTGMFTVREIGSHTGDGGITSVLYIIRLSLVLDVTA